MGGRSGFRLIRSIWFFRFLAPSNHRFRSDRSQNFTMMGAFSLLFSLWHAAICESAALQLEDAILQDQLLLYA